MTMQQAITPDSPLNVSNTDTTGSLIHIDQHSNLYDDAKLFVKLRFLEEYGAHINYFLPKMILSYQQGELNSVVGYSVAEQRELYLEQYLSEPIETLLSNKTGHITCRDNIVEVGNLASLSPGAFRRLTLSLIRYFAQQQYQWAVFTAIPSLLNTFKKLGVETTLLGNAEIASIHSNKALWGSYYQSSPVVAAINIGHISSGLCDSSILSRMLARAPLPENGAW